MADDLSFKAKLPAAPEDVFYAFSTAQGWRDWLCNSARFDSRKGGSYQLAWNSGWYTAGRVKKLRHPSRVQLTWRGDGDPESTTVRVDLKGSGDKTQVKLTHSGFGKGKGWKKARSEANKGWKLGFENLESIFTTGEDLRVTRRPMLGIILDEFNPHIAKEMGVPVERGVRLSRAIEGMGAEAAGLQPNDIIVEMAGQAIRGGTDLTDALQGKRAGDSVPVTVYRGEEKVTVEMELSGRPIPEFPLNPAAIAELLRPHYEEISKELRALFKGVSEEQADFRPGEGEWSAKENLAHLVDGEGYNTVWFTELMYDGEQEFSDQGENVHERLHAMVEMIPTVPALLDEFDLRWKETLAMLSRLEKLKRRKGPLWRIGWLLLEFPGTHERGHMEQMKAAIEAAKAAEPAEAPAS